MLTDAKAMFIVQAQACHISIRVRVEVRVSVRVRFVLLLDVLFLILARLGRMKPFLILA